MGRERKKITGQRLREGFIIILSLLILLVPSQFLITIDSTSESTWTQETNSDFENGARDDLIIVNSGENAYLRLQAESWVNKNPEFNFGILSYSAMASIYGTDNALIFGGGTSGNFNNYTWIYDLSEDTWNFIELKGRSPPARFQHELAPIWGTDKIIVFGGKNESYLIDTWIYDLSDNQWTEKITSNMPSGRTEFQLEAIYGTDKVLLYGGLPSNRETWVYDLSENNWTQMTTDDEPGARNDFAMAAIDGTDSVAIFGGIPVNQNDLWIYNLSKNTWTKRVQVIKPIPRRTFAMATIDGTDKIVLFGGWGNYQEHNDTWIYDYSENRWTELFFKSRPGPRDGHFMVPIFGTNKVLLQDGAYFNNDDTWVFEYSNYYTENGTFTSQAFHTGYNSSFNELLWIDNNSKNTEVKLQLRSGSSKRILDSNTFVGPDGNTDSYYTHSGTKIWSGHNNDVWIQFKAFLITEDLTETPHLKNVTISYNCFPWLDLVSVDSFYIKDIERFNFTVKYYDRNNEASAYVKICIDGFNYSMKEDDISDVKYSDGKEYNYYNIHLDSGIHTYQFFASDGNLNCSTNIEYLEVGVLLDRIEVNPTYLSLNIDDSRKFTAKGIDNNGKTIPISPKWVVNGGGIIDQEGFFIAKTAGTWKVFANISKISGYALVTVKSKNDQEIMDTDNDRIPDEWEINSKLNHENPEDALYDHDDDSLTNLEEYLNNTDIRNPDSDNDGLSDGDEIKIHKTNATNPDTDGDGHNDDIELDKDTDPLNENDYPKNPKNSPEKDDNLVPILIIIFIILIIVLCLLFIKFKTITPKPEIREERYQKEQVTQPDMPGYCMECGQQLSYIHQYGKYYCDYCRKYY